MNLFQLYKYIFVVQYICEPQKHAWTVPKCMISPNISLKPKFKKKILLTLPLSTCNTNLQQNKMATGQQKMWTCTICTHQQRGGEKA